MISKIALTNFKCFKNEIFPLAPLTLLSGMNGMGKSTVIQALLLLRQSFKSGQSTDKLIFNGNLVQLGRAIDLLSQDADEDRIEIVLNFDDSSETHIRGILEEKDWAQYDFCQAEIVPKIFSSVFRETLLEESLTYLTAERLGPRISLPSSINYARSNRDVGIDGEYVGQFLAEFGSKSIINDKLKYDLKDKQHTVGWHVKEWMGKISDSVDFETEVDTRTESVQVRYKYTRGGEWSDSFRATNVGFGISYSLPVVVALLTPFPNQLILLSNPEAHLHPAGQSAIGRLIACAAASGHQVIVETHSDHVLNGIRVAVKQKILTSDKVSTLHFAPDKDHLQPKLSCPILDKDGRYDSWPDGFFDEFEKDLAQLI